MWVGVAAVPGKRYALLTACWLQSMTRFVFDFVAHALCAFVRVMWGSIGAPFAASLTRVLLPRDSGLGSLGCRTVYEFTFIFHNCRQICCYCCFWYQNSCDICLLLGVFFSSRWWWWARRDHAGRQEALAVHFVFVICIT